MLFLLCEWSTYYDSTIQPTSYSETNYTTDALAVSGNDVYVTDCLFKDLTTTGDGGAINWEDLTNPCKLLIEQCVFYGCSAEEGGGLNLNLLEGEVVFDKISAIQCMATGTEAYNTYGLFSKCIVQDSGTAKNEYHDLLITEIDGEDNPNAYCILYSENGYIIYTNSNISGNAGSAGPLLINTYGSYDASNTEEFDMKLSYMTVTKNVASGGSGQLIFLGFDIFDTVPGSCLSLDYILIYENTAQYQERMLTLNSQTTLTNSYVNDNIGEASIQALADLTIENSIIATDCVYCIEDLQYISYSYSPADSVNSDFQSNHLSLEDFIEFIPQPEVIEDTQSSSDAESSSENTESSTNNQESSIDNPNNAENNGNDNSKDAPDDGKTNIGAIVGGVVGGLSFLAIIILIIICIIKNGGFDWCKAKVEEMINEEEEEEEEEEEDENENENEHKHEHHINNKDNGQDHQKEQTNDQIDPSDTNENENNEHQDENNDQLQQQET